MSRSFLSFVSFLLYILSIYGNVLKELEKTELFNEYNCTETVSFWKYPSILDDEFEFSISECKKNESRIFLHLKHIYFKNLVYYNILTLENLTQNPKINLQKFKHFQNLISDKNTTFTLVKNESSSPWLITDTKF